MKCSVLSWVSVLAMAAIPVVGCNDLEGAGGGGGSAGTGGSAGNELPCTEQGIRDAIAEGGGPHTFACDGPTTVVTEAQIVIDNDVILDGGGNLTVDGDEDHRVFEVWPVTVVELHRLVVSRGGQANRGAGIANYGTLGLTSVTVSDSHAAAKISFGGAIYNGETLTLTNSTVSGSSADYGGGIHNDGTTTLTNTTVSENTAGAGGGISTEGGIGRRGTTTLTNTTVSGNTSEVGGGMYINAGALSIVDSTVSGNTAEEFGGGILCTSGTNLTLTNSTVSGNIASLGGGIVAVGSPKGGAAPRLTLTDSTVSENTADSGRGIACEIADCTIVGSLVDGDCVGGGFDITSNGYNIESPGDTCGFDQTGDQVGVSTDELKLGPLQDNDGPTMTHALLPGSVAIDRIPEAECLDADGDPLTTDQRGFPRDSMCDVGAFEVQEGSL